VTGCSTWRYWARRRLLSSPDPRQPDTKTLRPALGRNSPLSEGKL
jgi:hypothetical protein